MHIFSLRTRTLLDTKCVTCLFLLIEVVVAHTLCPIASTLSPQIRTLGEIIPAPRLKSLTMRCTIQRFEMANSLTVSEGFLPSPDAVS